MLAVKLTKHKEPWLGAGSHVMPVAEWSVARQQIRNWIRRLRRSKYNPNPWWENHDLRYITLLRIPDEWPVKLCQEWYERLDSSCEFKPLHDYDQRVAQEMRLTTNCGPLIEEPELILGRPLPKSAILFTKDLRLLYSSARTKISRKTSRSSLGRYRP